MSDLIKQASIGQLYLNFGAMTQRLEWESGRDFQQAYKAVVEDEHCAKRVSEYWDQNRNWEGIMDYLVSNMLFRAGVADVNAAMLYAKVKGKNRALVTGDTWRGQAVEGDIERQELPEVLFITVGVEDTGKTLAEVMAENGFQSVGGRWTRL